MRSPDDDLETCCFLCGCPSSDTPDGLSLVQGKWWCEACIEDDRLQTEDFFREQGLSP